MLSDCEEIKKTLATKMEHFPLVSLIITSYNRSELIRSAIESALAQDYPNLEIIISDNCSTDNTHAVISEYLYDPRIKYSINETNIGMLQNFIKATNTLAQGEFITYVSSDDYLINSNFISDAVLRCQKYNNVVLVHGVNISEFIESNEFFLDASYEYYKNTFYKENYTSGINVLMKYPLCHSISFGGTLFNRKKFQYIRLFEGNLYSFDVQTVLQLMQLGDAIFIDKKTYVVRRHGENMTSMVSKANTYIDNLAYIETPYNYALERNYLDKSILNKWREDMYCNYCSQCMLNLYKLDKNEYKKFIFIISKNHPAVFKKITQNYYWYVNRVIFSAPFLTSIYLKSRTFARKSKLLLSTLFGRVSI